MKKKKNTNQPYPTYSRRIREHAQEITAGPPERKDKKRGKHEAGDLARIRVEPARDKRRADQARAEVSRGQCEPRYTARHARRAALVRCAHGQLASSRRFY